MSIPYAAVGEREFTLTILVKGDTADESQARLNRLIAALYITAGANEPRFGVLTFDGYALPARRARSAARRRRSGASGAG